MSWLTPLGFLGLIGLIILIIIYIIKPNFQQKVISSTFVWRLSLKYRKKRIPISKLRNILLFICQVLIISGMAMILAQPFIRAEKEETVAEHVVIIDASASMLAENDTDTRFERAVMQVRQLAEETLEENGRMTVILAGETASYVVQSAGVEFKSQLFEALDALLEAPATESCTYGSGDIEGAVRLAEQITSENTDVQVQLYTDTQYVDAGRIKVNYVGDVLEWNAAIMDVRSLLHENYYRFEIDMACYGEMDRDVRVYFSIYGVNKHDETDSGQTLNLEAIARCRSGEIETVVYGNFDPDEPDETILEDVEIYSYEYATVRIEEMDAFEYDNHFYLYGGKKPVLKIQYSSAMPNNYFATALDVLHDRLGNRWDVEYKEVKKNEEPATEGFDVYIFEHDIPKTLPEDGIVILANPNKIPTSAGIRLGQAYRASDDTRLSAGEDHPLMKGIDPANIGLTLYTQITSYDGYVPLMYCYDTPVVMAKNDPGQKIVVMSFSLNYSDFSMLMEFPLFLSNIFNYYMPSTMEEYVFEVNESIDLNCRSSSLTVKDPKNNDTVMTEFPGTMELKMPGVYTVTQLPISGKEVVENFFVRIPAAESNTAAVEDVLTNPYYLEKDNSGDLDLLFYFAAALVALLFMEWWLQTREQF